MFDMDFFGNMKPCSIHLARPSGELLGCVDDEIDESSASLTIGLNQQYELSFDVVKGKGYAESWYNYMLEGMYLFVDRVGLFKLEPPEEDLNGSSDTKTVKAHSCECELDDKLCQLKLNMGTSDSMEYLVEYDDDETENLVNPYTNIPYDWLLLYNTFPEQLSEFKEKFESGYFGTADSSGDINVTDEDLISELDEFITLIPRLKSRIVTTVTDKGTEEYSLEEYAIYYYDDEVENILSIVLTPLFAGRIDTLITFYTKYRDQLSLLTLVLDETNGNWTVGDIWGVNEGDYSLANRKYQYEVDENIYSFLISTMAEDIQCAMSFDLVNRRINVTPVEEVGEDTGITISYDNLLDEMEISYDDDAMCTRLYVTGADDLAINQVNFGLPYIDDLRYKLNAVDENGERIYVEDELAEKYMEFIDYRESLRDEYMQCSRDYNNYNLQIDELKYRVPNDFLYTDWGTYSLTELEDYLQVYNNLLVSLITMYKEDYTPIGLNDDGSVDENYIRTTMYWWDYVAYQAIITEIECAIATYPYYDDEELWSSDNVAKYKDKINAWETEWSLYGTIELQAKIDTYTANMEILAETAVLLYPYKIVDEPPSASEAEYYMLYLVPKKDGDGNIISDEYDVYRWVDETDYSSEDGASRMWYGLTDDTIELALPWRALTDEQKVQFGADKSGSVIEANYYYDTYMMYYNYKNEATAYLKELQAQIDELLEKQEQVQARRIEIVQSVTITNYFTEEEYLVLNRLFKDSTYTNENILVTSINDTVESIDIMYELLQDGQEKLSIYSRPQMQFSIEAENLLGLPEFESLWDSFVPGNYMMIQYRDSTYAKLRMLSYTINPCIPSNKDMEITFSNFIRSDAGINDYESMFGLSNSAGISDYYGSSSRYGYGDSDDSYLDSITETMLNRLLTSETFGTRVTNIILDTIDANTLTAKSASFGGLQSGTTIINGKCLQTGWIEDWQYAAAVGSKNLIDGDIKYSNGDLAGEYADGTIINLETGEFSFGGGSLTWDGDTLAVKGTITAYDGTIGGFTIGTSKLYGSVYETDSDGNIVYDDQGNEKIKYVIVMQKGSSDTNTAFAAGDSGGNGHSDYSECPFRVRMDGRLYAQEAHFVDNVYLDQDNTSIKIISASYGVDGAYDIKFGNLTQSLGFDIHYGAFTVGSDYMKFMGAVTDSGGNQVEGNALNIGSENTFTGNKTEYRVYITTTSTGDHNFVPSTDEIKLGTETHPWGDFTTGGDSTVCGNTYAVGTLSNSAESSTPNLRINTSTGALRVIGDSSERYKNVSSKVSSEDIDSLFDIPVYWFEYKEDYLATDDERYKKAIPGFIAEKWDEVLPIAVDHDAEGRAKMWNNNIVTPLMFEMIKENHSYIKELESKIETLENTIKELKG